MHDKISCQVVTLWQGVQNDYRTLDGLEPVNVVEKYGEVEDGTDNNK